MDVIPLLRPTVTGNELENIRQVIESRWWGQGRWVDEFEAQLAAYYNVKHALAVNSCTAALHLAMHALNINSNDTVVVPSLTFVSTGTAPLYVNAKVVFADIDEDTLCIDLQDAMTKTSQSRRIIIAVDYAGHPAVEQSPKDVTLVQDAAHACGGTLYGDLTCLSFHPVKNLATSDGGAILTNDDKAAAVIKKLRWCGIDKSTHERTGKSYSWSYNISSIGYKYHWNDIMAAIGLAQLSKLDDLNAGRREIAERYSRELAMYGLTLPKDHPKHTHHLYPIRVSPGLRDKLIAFMLSKGVSAGVHYYPIHFYKCFENDQKLPITERVWEELVSIPMYSDMSYDEQTLVIETIKEFMHDK